MNEEGPVNAVGGGNIAGIGVGPQGAPDVSKKKKKILSFAVFNRWSNAAKQVSDA